MSNTKKRKHIQHQSAFFVFFLVFRSFLLLIIINYDELFFSFFCSSLSFIFYLILHTYFDFLPFFLNFEVFLHKLFIVSLYFSTKLPFKLFNVFHFLYIFQISICFLRFLGVFEGYSKRSPAFTCLRRPITDKAKTPFLSSHRVCMMKAKHPSIHEMFFRR